MTLPLPGSRYANKLTRSTSVPPFACTHLYNNHSMSRGRATHALHIFVLASLATVPVLIVADAQFFIGRGASGFEVLAVALILVLVAPAALALVGLLAALVSPRLGWAVHLALIALLVALLASQALYPLDWPLDLQIPLVLGAGVAASVAYARLQGARSVVSALTPLPFIALAFVLFLTPVSGLVFAGEEEVEAAADPQDRAPVVMIVLDELPGTALMNERRRLDAARFPNVAALGEDATWFRNATTSRSDTELAVPTLETGRHAPLDSLPTATDHPRSLFTLLEGSRAMHVSEPWTNVCPERLCNDSTESTDEGDLGSILTTFPSILGYVSLPDAERIGIANPQESGASDRGAQVETFVDEIDGDEPPTLHFLHVLLPHKSWRYLPSGHRYPDAVGAGSALGGLEEWTEDEWLTLQQQQRFLLQMRFTDRLIGTLLRRLREVGLYDRSLIVFAADHGVSFRAGDRRRDATETNAPDILSVPLLVKLPHQRNGRIDDRPATTVDVVPTIADVLGTDVPWPVDGRSLLGELPPSRRIEIENLAGGELDRTPAEFARERDAALERQVEAFGDGDASLYAIGPHPELRDRQAEPLVGEPAGAEATIIDGEQARDYNPHSHFVPARIAGTLHGLEAGQPLAVALNGRVAATTYGYEGDRGVEFAAMVPPSRVPPGRNRLALYAIEGSARQPDAAPAPPAMRGPNGRREPHRRGR